MAGAPMKNIDHEESVILSGIKDGIEVTPEMLDEGARILWASGLVDGRSGADKLLLAEIYRAMLSLAPQCLQHGL